jgi:hypothetical protein
MGANVLIAQKFFRHLTYRNDENIICSTPQQVLFKLLKRHLLPRQTERLVMNVIEMVINVLSAVVVRLDKRKYSSESCACQRKAWNITC